MYEEEIVEDGDLFSPEFKTSKPTMFTALKFILEQNIEDGEINLLNVPEFFNNYNKVKNIDYVKLINIKKEYAQFYVEDENKSMREVLDVYFINDKLICMGAKKVDYTPIGFSDIEIKNLLSIS